MRLSIRFHSNEATFGALIFGLFMKPTLALDRFHFHLQLPGATSRAIHFNGPPRIDQKTKAGRNFRSSLKKRTKVYQMFHSKESISCTLTLTIPREDVKLKAIVISCYYLELLQKKKVTPWILGRAKWTGLPEKIMLLKFYQKIFTNILIL